MGKKRVTPERGQENSKELWGERVENTRERRS